MNVRIVITFLRLLLQLRRWKRVNLLVRNVAAKIPRDYLMDLVTAMGFFLMTIPRQVVQLAREEPVL